jgi:hypothetical protein
VSDHVVLNTTEGYQTALYHTYVSDEVLITGNKFITGSDSKTIAGTKITFPIQPTIEDMWYNNGNSAAKWDAEYITRSGYNGDYAHPYAKYNNSNTVGSDPSVILGGQPNAETPVMSGLTEGYGKNFGNMRMVYEGLDIIDSTDTNTKKWSASDGKDPVENGEWDTGRAYVTAEKKIGYQNPGGTDYATEADGKTFREEVTYTDGTDKVNNIVVHNPISVEYALVLPNDEKYDLRTTASLAEGGDPVSRQAVCPRDESCENAAFTCTNHTGSPHKASCYRNVQTGTQHTGGLNAHEHTDFCYTGTDAQPGEKTINKGETKVLWTYEAEADFIVTCRGTATHCLDYTLTVTQNGIIISKISAADREEVSVAVPAGATVQISALRV